MFEDDNSELFTSSILYTVKKGDTLESIAIGF
ncbi:MAG: LysM peptidoglycan-binding domain-containing protein [Candidatus Peribacteria bacterium]|nr:LysM peptidoglycan-binding domain-containing protein [Candidatus Peribacteria bacterium]